MIRPGPTAWAGSGNDYRGIERLEPVSVPEVALIVTARGDVWDATLQAIGNQVHDGGLRVLARTGDTLPEAAGQWPVLSIGLSDPVVVADAEVVIFINGGEVPGRGWLERHIGWHRRASNLVVQGVGANDGGVRRSRRLLSGDEAFVEMRPSNVSMRTEHWEQVGSPVVLDLETGWRLWNDGLFFVPDTRADVAGVVPAHAAADTPMHLEDRIPHRRFRSTPSPLHMVPKVSWVVGISDTTGADAAWRTCQQSTFSDHEVVFHGPSAPLQALQNLSEVNPRVSVVAGTETATFGAAVKASRGELVAILDPRAVLAPESLAKAVSRFESNPTVGVVRFGYSLQGDRYLRLDDLSSIDQTLGANGIPLFSVVSRRELMKDIGLDEDPPLTWSRVLARNSPALVISPLVVIDETAPLIARAPGLAEASAMGLRELARSVVRDRRERAASTTGIEDQEPGESHEDKVSVAYVGFTGHDNLGDEAVMVAIQRLMPWAKIESDPVDPRLLMVGGGTLINGRRYYLNRLLRQESPTVERALFGTGVRSPDYWGVTEPMEDWFSFIDTALVAAVRGPDSVKNLRKLGYHRDLPVIGDPALSLRPAEGTVRVEGRVVVCPVYTSGNLHGGSDDAVFTALAELIGKLSAEGREIVYMSAFPQDDRWLIDLMRRNGSHDLPYVAGYADIDDTMTLLASADLVIGERLHAAIMAAAAGTPFIGLEYRPKVRDFARSVGQEDAVVRTDELHRLEELCARVLREADEIAAATAPYVEDYRHRQAEASALLKRQLGGG